VPIFLLMVTLSPGLATSGLVSLISSLSGVTLVTVPLVTAE
jgi:hypothetical protein